MGSSASVRSRSARIEGDSNFLPRPAPATLAMDVKSVPAEAVRAAESRQGVPDAIGQGSGPPVDVASQGRGRLRRRSPGIIDKK